MNTDLTLWPPHMKQAENNEAVSEDWLIFNFNRMSSYQEHMPVFPKLFLLVDPFCLQKITMSAHILVT